jgi:hypothetical protein
LRLLLSVPNTGIPARRIQLCEGAAVFITARLLTQLLLDQP